MNIADTMDLTENAGNFTSVESTGLSGRFLRR